MIEVNATTNGMIAMAWVLSIVLGGCAGFGLRGWLMASKDGEAEKEDSLVNLTICVQPTCQRRKTLNGWFNERLLIIGYNRLLKQQDKEMDMRAEGTEPTLQDGFIPNDGTHFLCPKCIRAEGCLRAINGDNMSKCDEFEEEA